MELIRGEASFTGPGKLSIALRDGGKRQLTAPQIFINSGTHSALPAIEGLDTVPHLNNESIMELDRAPEHLLIVGGGYIGIEFSQMFRRFGSKVTFALTVPAPALAKSRETVAGWTLKSLAASAAVLVPVDTIVTISSC